MDKRVFLFFSAASTALLLSGCSEAPTAPTKVEAEAKKEPAKAPEAVTAQPAFFEMYKSGRAWATDLMALSVASGEVPSIKNEEGKAGVWTVTFVSPARREARIFTYAVADGAPDIRKGVDVGNVLPWGGATPSSKPFSNSEFTVDSDAAYKTALEKASGWLKTHPNQKVSFRLGSASRYPAPVWYVMWGTTKNGYAVLVNALTNAVVK